jgi:Fe-S cluster biogenesis protein NfuA
MLDSKGKPIGLTGNSTWSYDWAQWGFDHFPPSDLGEYDYYRYRRYTKERPRKTADQYLAMLNSSSSSQAKKSAKYYNMIKGKHTEFYKIVNEKESQRLQKVEEDKRLKEIKDQEITFNEQTNSGDFNETPITDVNLDGGCSGCGVDLQNIIKETQNKENYMKFAGIAAAGVIGLLLYSKGGLK